MRSPSLKVCARLWAGRTETTSDRGRPDTAGKRPDRVANAGRAHAPYSRDFEKRQRIADAAEDPLGGLSFEVLEIDEIAKTYGELATVAKRDGILALEAYIPPRIAMAYG